MSLPSALSGCRGTIRGITLVDWKKRRTGVTSQDGGGDDGESGGTDTSDSDSTIFKNIKRYDDCTFILSNQSEWVCLDESSNNYDLNEDVFYDINEDHPERSRHRTEGISEEDRRSDNYVPANKLTNGVILRNKFKHVKIKDDTDDEDYYNRESNKASFI